MRADIGSGFTFQPFRVNLTSSFHAAVRQSSCMAVSGTGIVVEGVRTAPAQISRIGELS
jgi:hypothetical protein